MEEIVNSPQPTLFFLPWFGKRRWLLATATARAVPEHLLVPGPGGAEGKNETKSQVMPPRPFWPPEEGKGSATSGPWKDADGSGGSEDGKFPFGQSNLRGLPTRDSVEADSEALMGFERRWGM